VNHATQTIATLDMSRGTRRRARRAFWLWRCEGQCSVGPVAVVVGHEHVKRPLQVPLVHNQQTVETFRAGGADELLRDPRNVRELSLLCGGTVVVTEKSTDTLAPANGTVGSLPWRTLD
jgi:hypothetical protein